MIWLETFWFPGIPFLIMASGRETGIASGIDHWISGSIVFIKSET